MSLAYMQIKEIIVTVSVESGCCFVCFFLTCASIWLANLNKIVQVGDGLKLVPKHPSHPQPRITPPPAFHYPHLNYLCHYPSIFISTVATSYIVRVHCNTKILFSVVNTH